MKKITIFILITIISIAVLVKVAAKFECFDGENKDAIFWQPEDSYAVLGYKPINNFWQFAKKANFFAVTKNFIEKNCENSTDIEKINKIIYGLNRLDKVISADNSLSISLAVLPIESEKIENIEDFLDSMVITMYSKNVETEKKFNELMTKYFKVGKEIGDFASFEKELSIGEMIIDLEFTENSKKEEIIEAEKIEDESETFYCLRKGNTIYLTFSPEIFLKNYNRTANKEIAKIDFSKYQESKNANESIFINISEIVKINPKLPEDVQAPFLDLYNIKKSVLAFEKSDVKKGEISSFFIENLNVEEFKKYGVDYLSTQPISFFNKLPKDALIAADINNLKNTMIFLIYLYKKTIPNFTESFNQSLEAINLNEEEFLNLFDGEYFLGIYEGVVIITLPRIIIGVKSVNSAKVAALVKNLVNLANATILPQKEGDLEVNAIKIPMIPFKIYFIEKDDEFLIGSDKNLILEMYNKNPENKLINSSEFKDIAGGLNSAKANSAIFVNSEKIATAISNALTMFDKKTEESQIFLDLFGSITGFFNISENKKDKIEQNLNIKFKMQDEQK